MPTWDLVALNNGVRTVIPQWSGLTISQRIGAADTITFSVPGDENALDDVTERITDIVAWRRHDAASQAAAYARGRVLEMNDTLDDGPYDVQVSCSDVRSILARRMLFADRAYTAQAQASIVWDLISYTQSQTNGSLGITVGNLDSVQSTVTGDTTMVRTRNYVAGDEIGKLIDDLAAGSDGFDWWVDVNLQLYVATPRRTRTVLAPLVYQANVARLERRSTSSKYRNVVRVKGDAATTPVVVSNTSVAANGRWEQTYNLNDLRDQAAVSERANRQLQESGSPRADYVVTLSPGVWGGEVQLELGDVVPLWAARGRLTIDVQARVEEIVIQANGDGGEEVRLALREEP